MFFYRLLMREELEQKRIHKNTKSFEDCINTHKYIKGQNYIHLFLNAESCFENFEHYRYDKCFVAQFDIPEEIVRKYGIGLGGYSPLYNNYNRKYRVINQKESFWVPEIAIPESDFNYNWCTEVYPALDEHGNCYLPDHFITEELTYREIVYDGYLLGFKNVKELLQKYENMLKSKDKQKTK